MENLQTNYEPFVPPTSDEEAAQELGLDELYHPNNPPTGLDLNEQDLQDWLNSNPPNEAFPEEPDSLT
jgi:hypothetical protein